MLSVALTLAACSQGVSTLDKRIISIKNNAEAIKKRTGTAKGHTLTGDFELKIWYGQLSFTPLGQRLFS